MKDKGSSVRTEKDSPESGPEAIRVTPEGSREVDPMSIITSTTVVTHLKHISGMARIDVKKQTD